MKHLIDGQRGRAEFVTQEDGAGTVFSLLLFVSLVALGGIAVDVSSVTTARTELQVTADAVDNASLVSREGMAEADARAVGVTMAAANMTTAEAGVVIRPEEIVFGRWNSSSRTFTPEPDSRRAVQVVARQDTTNANPLATFMLRIIGFDQWDVSVVSVFATERPGCMRDGYIANGLIDLQSGNEYRDGFCIHSNSNVKVSSNNFFEDTTNVTMPNWETDLVLPASGMTTNIGLADVVGSDEYDIRILDRLNVIIDGIRNPDSEHHPTYLSDLPNQRDVSLPQRVTATTDFQTGRVHTRTCNGNGGAALALEVDVVGVAIITNCRVSLGQNVNVINSVIVSTSDSDRAIEGSAGVTIGIPDNCAPGGEAQLIASRGSIQFPSDLGIYGSQLIALNDVTFSARGTGVEGVSIVAGGEISQTSGARMGFCGNLPTGNNFEVDYFKLVQ